MAGFVESTVNDIDARITELQGELDALQAARAALVGDGNTRPAADGRRGRARPGRARRNGRGAAPSRGATAGRRRVGTRADQALELVRARPGITIPEIAESMHIEPNYLYRVLPKLALEKKVSRDGQGWRAAAGGSDGSS